MLSRSTDIGTHNYTNPAFIVPEHYPFYKHGLSILAKNEIEDPELDKDPYPCIIWYIWKAKNDKLFKGIDRDPLESFRHAES